MYWQISHNPAYRKFIGIPFEGKNYVENILILGIIDTIFALTKVMRNILFHINDYFLPQNSTEHATRNKFL